MTVHGYADLLKQHQKRVSDMQTRVGYMTARVVEIQEKLMRAAHPMFQKKNNDRLAAQRVLMFVVALIMSVLVTGVAVTKAYEEGRQAAIADRTN